MVKLFCALVNKAAGSAFPVEIEEDKSVSDLKKAIKKENPNKIRCDANQLQLYLAKTPDGRWLPRERVDAVTLTLDGKGRLSLPSFVELDPLLRINNAKYSGANFQPKEQEIHVLVVVPWTQGGTRRRHAREEQATQSDDQLLSGSGSTRARRANDHGYDSELASMAIHLVDVIHRCDYEKIFDVGSSVQLPFPSLLAYTNRFQLNSSRSFTYQARSKVNELYEDVVSKWHAQVPVTITVAGTSGYGKSHLLAVLVLLLLKAKPVLTCQDEHATAVVPFVCYIPDCATLLEGEYDVVAILQRNVVVNMPHYTEPLDTVDDIRHALRGRKVILVAALWDEIDDGKSKNPQNQQAMGWLDKCLGTSTVCVTVRGLVTMDATIWRDSLSTLDTSAMIRQHHYHLCYGGLSDQEFGGWLAHHPSLFTEQKEELALVTGKMPLLLAVFMHAYRDGDPWRCVVQQAQQDDMVEHWMLMSLVDFYKDKDWEVVWKVYTSTRSSVPQRLLDPENVDFRFFYPDSNTDTGGTTFSASSELVSRLLYRVLFELSETNMEKALLSRWPCLLENSPSQSVRGFHVKEIIKAQICKHGVVGKYPKRPNWSISRTRFSPGTEQITLRIAVQQVAVHHGTSSSPRWVLLDPEIFDYGGVDMILVTAKMLVGIHVTIDETMTATHSLTPFLSLWGPLAAWNNMEIRGLCVAPDRFVHGEKHVETVFLKNVFYDLWARLNQFGAHPRAAV